MGDESDYLDDGEDWIEVYGLEDDESEIDDEDTVYPDPSEDVWDGTI